MFTWIVLAGATTTLGVGLVLARRQELARMAAARATRERVVRAGGDLAGPREQPVVDLSRCLGCGTCVVACPEDGVLELIHGQASVVRAARCVGVAACERECPVGAIELTPDPRRAHADVPRLEPSLEATGRPGLFLAGEVTAQPRIKTAVEHGVRVVREIARRAKQGSHAPGTLDLVVVGAGPAGLAASLEARRTELNFVTLEREATAGGTVATYPRGKLVVNEPFELPLFGTVARNAYAKEEIVALWDDLAQRHELPLRCGEGLERVEADGDEFVVWTQAGAYRTRALLLAVGRRGAPRRLGVPGEALDKVEYALSADAPPPPEASVLVVGGGDSAIEAALALAGDPGRPADRRVTLSYRKDTFFRASAANEAALHEAGARGALDVILSSEVVAIGTETVDLTVADGPRLERRSLPNDRVLVLAGGTPPTALLRDAGVSLGEDEEDAAAPPTKAQGSGLTGGLALALAAALAVLLFAVQHHDYYGASTRERALHPLHERLRPGRGLGLLFGFGAAAAIALNLVYLLRRSPRSRLGFGSLRRWMTLHVATGVAAVLGAFAHAAFAPGPLGAGASAGGHAFWALVAIGFTGALGRYFYAAVPRAANGRELELDEVRARLAEDEHRVADAFASDARAKVVELVDGTQWRPTLLGRIAGLLTARRALRRALRELQARATTEAIAEERLDLALEEARRAHRLTLEARRLEDLRALLAGWRWIHRWASALLLLLFAIHVGHSLLYGGVLEELWALTWRIRS